MIKVLLIDDEPDCLSLLKEHVSSLPDYKVIGCAGTFEEAMELTTEKKPDLVFLDIALGEKSGFDYMERFKNENFSVVITTAYPEHSLRAIKLSALDFLLKPFTKHAFYEAICRFETDSKKFYKKQMEVLLNNLQHSRHMKISILVKDGIRFIDVLDIIRCQACGSYTEIYLDINTKHIVSSPLRVYEEYLEPLGFFRVHRSHLINMHKVEKYLNSGFVVMKDGSKVEVSSRKKAEFLESLSGL